VIYLNNETNSSSVFNTSGYFLAVKKNELVDKINNIDDLSVSDFSDNFGEFSQKPFNTGVQLDNLFLSQERESWFLNNLKYYIDEKIVSQKQLYDETSGKTFSMDIKSSRKVFFIYIRDTTDSIKTENNFLKTLEMHHIAERTSKVGTWDLNPQSMHMHITPGWLESLGYKSVPEDAAFNFWRSLVYPSDLNKLKTKFNSYIIGNTDTFEIEYRIIDASGNILWVLDKGNIIEFSKDGKPLRVIGIFGNITHRKENINRLGNLLLALEKSSSTIMICDKDRLIEYVNPKFYKNTGYTAEEVIGKHINEFRPYPQDKKIYEEISRILTKKGEWKGEELRVRKNGEEFWENVSLSLIKDDFGNMTHIIRISEDISEIKKAHMIAERFFEVTLDLLCIFDFDGKIIKTSNSWMDTLGYTEDEIVGGNLMDLIHPEDYEKSAKIIENLKSGKNVFSFENRFKTKNGKYKTFYWNAIPSKYENMIFGAARDITYEKQIQDNFMEIVKLEHEAAEAKSRFFMNMTHEIRTPMNGIMGMITLLKKTKIETEQKFFVETLDKSAKNLLNVLNKILDYAQLENTDDEVKKVEFNFREFVHELKKTFSEEALVKGLEFIIDSDKTIPQKLIGDVIKLNDIVANLISNAIKFTSSGFIRVTIRKITEMDNRVIINFAVSDSGIGIKESDFNKIFRSFSQANDSITREYGGTGLGLSISNKLIKSLGGEIEVSSEVGKGSVFEFMLEFEIPSPQNVETDVDTYSIINKKINVLVAEDDKINQYVTELFLKSKDWNVTIVENGLEALKQIEQREFDLILMDLKMPVLDGIRTTEIIREKEKGSFKHVPIVAVTAYTIPGEKDRCFEKGMDGYISKPIDENLFFKVINDILKKV